jgi:hypothetical protein
MSGRTKKAGMRAKLHIPRLMKSHSAGEFSRHLNGRDREYADAVTFAQPRLPPEGSGPDIYSPDPSPDPGRHPLEIYRLSLVEFPSTPAMRMLAAFFSSLTGPFRIVGKVA